MHFITGSDTWGDGSTTNIYNARVYSYDENSRLDSANYPGVGRQDFTYDWVGNRTAPGGMEYNAADQLTRWPDEQRYEYFANGNLRYLKNDAGILQKTYAYTYANLLSSVDHEGLANDSTMLWDASGNRVRFTSSTNANPYYFVYDATAGIPAVIEEVTPTGSVYYVREPSGALIARVSGQTTQYYHFDDLGNTLFLTDGTGTLTDKYSYDAWGNGTHEGNTNQPYQYVGLWGYYTHYQDANLSLLHLGVRFYDPRVGRFTQRDPLAVKPSIGNENAFAYATNNPCMKTDPSGLYAEFWCVSKPKNCPDIDKYVKEAIKALENKECWNAVTAVGCADFMEKMRDPKKNPLQGITIYCKKLPENTAGHCASARDITIDCGKGNPAATILHELTHACAFNAGEKPNPTGPWTCDCGAYWDLADITWERNAEQVRHACFK